MILLTPEQTTRLSFLLTAMQDKSPVRLQQLLKGTLSVIHEENGKEIQRLILPNGQVVP